MKDNLNLISNALLWAAIGVLLGVIVFGTIGFAQHKSFSEIVNWVIVYVL